MKGKGEEVTEKRELVAPYILPPSTKSERFIFLKIMVSTDKAKDVPSLSLVCFQYVLGKKKSHFLTVGTLLDVGVTAAWCLLSSLHSVQEYLNLPFSV